MTEDEYNELKVGDHFSVTSECGKYFRSGVIHSLVDSPDGVRLGFVVKIEMAPDKPEAVGCYLPVSKDMVINDYTTLMRMQ